MHHPVPNEGHKPPTYIVGLWLSRADWKRRASDLAWGSWLLVTAPVFSFMRGIGLYDAYRSQSRIVSDGPGGQAANSEQHSNSAIQTWIAGNYTAQTIDGVTMYDLGS